MRNGKRGAIPSDIGSLIDELDEISRRLGILEAPSGEALSSTVAKLQGLVSDIQAELDAYLITRYTNAQIDTKDAAVVAQILPAIAGTLAGNVGIGGQLSVGGAFLAPNAYSTDITWTRRSGWWGNDGRAGYASSSRDKKTSIHPADETALRALLDVGIFDFIYRAEIRRRTSKRINDGEDYMPARELGLMAQDLDDAGLGFFVYHDEDGNPEGIEYGMLTIALLAIARGQRDDILDLARRVRDLELTAG